MTTNNNSRTFVNVTNKDIYEKLLEIEGHQLRTNGKVKLAMWVGTTALSLSIIAIGIGVRG